MPSLIDNLIIELEKGNYSEVIGYCNELIKQQPHNYFFHEVKGNCCFQKGLYEESLFSYSQAIELLKPEDDAKITTLSNLFNLRGYIYFILNKFGHSEQDFRKSVELKPNYAEAYYNLGNTYRKLSDLNQAVTCYTKAIELKRDYTDAYNARGHINYKLKNESQAIADFSNVIQLKPDFAAAFYNRGMVHHTSGNNKDAVKDWRKAVELNPKYEQELGNKIKDFEIIPPAPVEKTPPIPVAAPNLSEELKKLEERLSAFPESKIEPETPVRKQEEPYFSSSFSGEDELRKLSAMLSTPPSKKNDIEIPDFDIKKIMQAGIENETESHLHEDIVEDNFVEGKEIIPDEVKKLHDEILEKPKSTSPPWHHEEEKRSILKSPAFTISLIVAVLIVVFILLYSFFREIQVENAVLIQDSAKTGFKGILSTLKLQDSTRIQNADDSTGATRTETPLQDEQKQDKINNQVTKVQDADNTKTESQVTTQKETSVNSQNAPVTDVVEGRSDLRLIIDNGKFYIQTDSYREKSLAEKKASIIKQKGLKAFISEADLGSKGIYYRVRVGPYGSKEEAVKTVQGL